MALTSTSWKPGTSGNPKGRPKREHEAAYLSIMHRLVSPETWAQITERAVQDALAGDATARAWLAKYLLPEKPDPFADVAAIPDDSTPDAVRPA